MTRTVHAVDLFCGAGGTSTGLALACRELGVKVDLVAVNHWPRAIETHSKNHPWATHLCQRVEALDPLAAVPGGRLDLLVGSPECRHFSVARGGRPVQDQLRASAWHLVHWLELLRVESLLVENVPEFQSWGPLSAKGRPIEQRKGETFKAWTSAIRSLGYNIDARVLNAADYGDATSRRRLFVVARRGRRPIQWPRPEFSRRGKIADTRRWRSAKEIIDWSIQGQSIFARERPLAPNTVARIVEGLRRFGGEELRPFLVLMEHWGGARSADEPVSTITTAKGGSMGVAEPFIISMVGRNLAPHSVEDPLPTILTRCEPYLVRTTFHPSDGRMGAAPRSTEEPVPTILGSNEGIAVVEPFILPPEGVHRGNAPRSVNDPTPTVTSRGGGHLVEPFLTQYHGGPDGRRRVRSTEDPLPTLDTSNRVGLVEPFLTTYYRQGGVYSVDRPAPTITTKDRIALVQPVVNGKALDIRFRMLEPKELAAAMGFPEDYAFTGNRSEVVKQIGNAVAVNIAKALCLSLLSAPSRSPLTVLEEEGVVA